MAYAGRTAIQSQQGLPGGPAPPLGFGRVVFSVDCIISRDLGPWPETDIKRDPF